MIRNELIAKSSEPFVADDDVDHWVDTETVLSFVRKTVLANTKLMNRSVVVYLCEAPRGIRHARSLVFDHYFLLTPVFRFVLCGCFYV